MKKIFFNFIIIFLITTNLHAKKVVNFKNNTLTINKKNENFELLKSLGIEIVSLRLTGYGKFIDFRYKVIDIEKASEMFNPKIKCYLFDPKTGNKFYIPHTPKVGSLRSYGTPVKNRVYFMLFSNNGVLKKGSAVNIAIGDTIIENLVIE